MDYRRGRQARRALSAFASVKCLMLKTVPTLYKENAIAHEICFVYFFNDCFDGVDELGLKFDCFDAC